MQTAEKDRLTLRGALARLLRLALALATVAAAMLLGAAFLLPLAVDTQALRRGLEEAASRLTGLEARLEGTVALTVFPELALRVEQLRLATPGAGETGEPLLEAHGLILELQALPLLLRQEAEAVGLRLSRLRLAPPGAWQGRPPWGALEGLPLPRLEVTRLSLPLERGLALAGRLKGHRQGRAWQVSLGGELAWQGGQRPLRLEARLEPEADRLAVHALKGQAGEDLRVEATALLLASGDWRAEGLRFTGPGGLEVSGRLRVRDEGAQVEARFRASARSLRALLRAFGLAAPATRDPEALGRTALEGRLQRQADGSFLLDATRLRLDDSTGSGRLELVALAPPTGRLELELDRLELERYLPPAEIPLTPPPRARLNGRLRVEKLVVGGLVLRGLEAPWRWQERRLRLRPVEAEAASGRLRADVELGPATTSRTGGDAPPGLRLRLEAGLQEIRFEHLPWTPWLAGGGRLLALVQGEGGTAADLVRELAGELRLDVWSGRFPKLPLDRRLREAFRGLLEEAGRSAAALRPGGADTPFRRLRLRARLQARMLELHRVDLLQASLELRGRGRWTPGEAAVLELEARPAGRLAEALGPQAAKVSVPVRLRLRPSRRLEVEALELELGPARAAARTARLGGALRRQLWALYPMLPVGGRRPSPEAGRRPLLQLEEAALQVLR